MFICPEFGKEYEFCRYRLYRIAVPQAQIRTYTSEHHRNFFQVLVELSPLYKLEVLFAGLKSVRFSYIVLNKNIWENWEVVLTVLSQKRSKWTVDANVLCIHSVACGPL